MPIFEYRCGQCSQQFERLISGGDPNPTCPDCGSDEVNKLFSTFGHGSSGGGGCNSSSGFS